MEIDPVLLSRIQFAFTVSFHIIFPSFTIGLVAWIATLLGMSLATGREHYRGLARFWTKVFAISFAMGVVSGIVMTFQFGTNWSGFSAFAGNVIGPIIGYEVLSAFFLEATFLGLMLFGWDRLPRGLHFAATAIVAAGTAFSAFWILSANSWMQYPTGFEVKDDVAVPTDWLDVVFSPMFPVRFAHMLLAAYITTGFVVLAVGARYWLEGRHESEARIMVRMALGILMVLVPAQLFVGDQAGEKVREYQPAKLAAMEAHWDSDESPVPFVVIGWPNQKEQRNDFALEIPYASSLIVTRSLDGAYTGLDAFPRADQPPVAPVFFTFRIMVGAGLLMLLAVLAGGVLWARGRLFEAPLYMRALRHGWPVGFVAVLTGWFTSEIGRQPWIVHGQLRTEDAATTLSLAGVGASLAAFVVVYAVIFFFGLRFIRRVLTAGPAGVAETAVPAPGYSPIATAHGGPARGALQPGE